MKNFQTKTSLDDTPNLLQPTTRVLAVNTAETETIPAGALAVVITPILDDLYIANGSTPVVPVADLTDGSAPICIAKGASRIFKATPGTEIRMISTLANIVGVEYYN